MKWSTVLGVGLVGGWLAACGGHTAEVDDAGSDASAAGAGGSSGGGGGTSSTGGAGSGTGGAGGSSGSGGVVDAGGSDAKGGAAGTGGASGGTGGGTRDGSAGSGGSTFDGAGDSCAVDRDCPPIPCLTSPCPESVCAMGEGAHQCVMRQHPAIAQCPPGDAGPFCCTSDAQCTAQPRGYCIPYSYRPSCTQNLHIPPPLPGNRCVYDACASDSDCTAQANGFCSPDFPRQCVYAPCRTNADCSRRAGGKCVLALVCEWSAYRGAFCRYGDDPCRANAACGLSDAGGPMFCVAKDDGHGTYCKDGGLLPP